MTVNTPMTPDTNAAMPPMIIAVCTGTLAKKPDAKIIVDSDRMTDYGTGATWAGCFSMASRISLDASAAITRTRP